MAEGDEIEVEYVFEDPISNESDPSFKGFANVFDAFKVKTEVEKIKDEYDRYYKKETGSVDTLNRANAAERIFQEEINERKVC
jgi:hypothetical protein